MSWYAGTFYCGHEGYVNIIGPASNTLMVGVGTDGNVTGISIIDQSETPGLGAVYAQDSEKGSRFRDSFQGKGQDLTTADVDYISGATVSANAICTAVNAATACVAAYQG